MDNKSYCEDCYFNGQCEDPGAECEYFSPTDEDNYCEQLVDRLRREIIPAGRSYLPKGNSDSKAYDDGLPSIYHYYRQMMNEALRDVRSGNVAFLYYESHLKDFLRYEPDVEVWLRDGVYYIRKHTR